MAIIIVNTAGIILDMVSGNERRHYIITLLLIGWPKMNPPPIKHIHDSAEQYNMLAFVRVMKSGSILCSYKYPNKIFLFLVEHVTRQKLLINAFSLSCVSSLSYILHWLVTQCAPSRKLMTRLYQKCGSTTISKTAFLDASLPSTTVWGIYVLLCTFMYNQTRWHCHSLVYCKVESGWFIDSCNTIQWPRALNQALAWTMLTAIEYSHLMGGPNRSDSDMGLVMTIALCVFVAYIYTRDSCTNILRFSYIGSIGSIAVDTNRNYSSLLI